MPGRPGTEHPRTDEITGGREGSPGGIDAQKQTVNFCGPSTERGSGS